jgi:GxxExxY protein
MIGDVLDRAVEEVATKVMDGMFVVHRKLGPGLLESIYEEALCMELAKLGLKVVRQKMVPVIYDGVRLATDLRLDILVNDCVIVEVKSVETLLPIHKAQLFTCLKLTGLRLGFLVNFNVELMRDGFERVIR